MLNLILLVSAELISFCVSLHECGSWEFDWRICSSLTACSEFLYESYMNLELETCTGNLNLQLGTWTGTLIYGFCRL